MNKILTLYTPGGGANLGEWGLFWVLKAERSLVLALFDARILVYFM